jgi:putative DNA primase/helicase
MAKTKKEQSAATKITTLVGKLRKEYGAELFHTPSGDPYLYAPVFSAPGVVAYFDCFPLNRDAAGRYLRQQFYNADGAAVTASALKDAIEQLIAPALQGPQHEIYVRVAGFADRIYLDLADQHRQVVTVTTEGWTVGACPRDIRFVRRAGTKALPTPVPTDERLEQLIPQILNLSDKRSQQRLIAWWVVALAGRKPFFILAISGEAGSAKTSAAVVIRTMIDPNEVDHSSTPKDERDLMIAARAAFVAAFDNLSGIRDDMADALCRLATGSGFRTRQLTTDDTEVLFKAARPIAFNGIPDLLSRGDLSDRSLRIELDAIPDSARRTEEDVFKVMAEYQPRILGALLNVLVGMLKVRPTFKPDRLPRMADASLTVMAAETALGWEQGTFLQIMDENSHENAVAVVDGDPVYEMLTSSGLQLPWDGELKDLVNKIPVGEDDHKRPWNPKRLQTHLTRLKGPLRKVGINVARLKKYNDASGKAVRPWTVSRENVAEKAESSGAKVGLPFDDGKPF